MEESHGNDVATWQARAEVSRSQPRGLRAICSLIPNFHNATNPGVTPYPVLREDYLVEVSIR